MSIIAELAAALGGARVQDSCACRTPDATHHFWSIFGGKTAYLIERKGRFVTWEIRDEPMSVVYRQFIGKDSNPKGVVKHHVIQSSADEKTQRPNQRRP
ncbi:hypothetical protein [Acidihalobacter prosperus]|uniref:Uncharacterized protein n=1 Tax=Acidihalobacter prosperus TaxID=160660 RepID=A0A1A6C322_9GAMM|nr:hypothetical protein [Acidihalobacter prosperus]OBS08954.1 hypothetical protein Thpro_022071 [Acidihalobacter prosperus]